MKRENCEIFNDSDREGLFARVSEFISEIAERSIAARGVFLFGYSGGSSASFFEKFKFSSVSSAWHLFPVDERVECGEAETNYFAIRAAWKEADLCTFHVPKGSGSVEEIAEEFDAEVKQVFSVAKTDCFDFLLLGLGPDGHTASLFPNHPDFLQASNPQSTIIPVRNSPKPPPNRISMSPSCIKSARECAFVVCGSPEKAAVIGAVLRGDLGYPPAVVAPHAHWFLDHISAGDLMK
jgi:6-phosphogluconolactonase